MFITIIQDKGVSKIQTGSKKVLTKQILKHNVYSVYITYVVVQNFGGFKNIKIGSSNKFYLTHYYYALVLKLCGNAVSVLFDFQTLRTELKK